MNFRYRIVAAGMKVSRSRIIVAGLALGNRLGSCKALEALRRS
jgi:hypothetical protein